MSVEYIRRPGKPVFRHGKRIETDELVPTLRARISKDPKDRLFGCPIWWVQCVRPVVRTKDQLIVAVYLWRRRIVCGSEVFDVPNGELKICGVSRKAKKRTLELLAIAGRIRVTQHAKSAPLVTILTKKPRRT
jgi:hypothetical protein